MYQQLIVFSVILVSLFLFVNGKVRYDFVALLALLVLALAGIVPASNAFLGFGHPAVITVAAILVVSSALLKTGALDQLVRFLNRGGKSISVKIAALMIMTAALSSFMNNVGALALIMPIAIKVGKHHKISASYLLMPVAFSSLLGGLITEIGTPPNLIISTYRVNAGLESFSFFDFAPVGIGLTFIGIIFISFIGWHLIPKRKSDDVQTDFFEVDDYMSEVYIPEGNKNANKSIRDMLLKLNLDVNIVSIIRGNKTIIAPNASNQIEECDLLVIKADHNELSKLIEKSGFILKGSKVIYDESGKMLSDEEHTIVEVVLRDDSPAIGRNIIELDLRRRYSANLVAVSRNNISSYYRLKSHRFRPGDILLLQCSRPSMQETLTKLRALPLAERGVDLSSSKLFLKRNLTIGLFLLSIIATTAGLVSVQVSFVSCAILMVLINVITPKEFYEAIEWPIIIMLGALLPIGEALQFTGGADTIAGLMIRAMDILNPSMMVVLLMVITMLLTNMINNAAAAVLMAPIAISLSIQMGVSVDPLLMGVAVSASSAFMTPIGHQSCTLVMGPGGYRFGDYWRMGLPVSLLVLLIGTPLLLFFWPL
ncbi:MAG: anion permease [Dethiosulfatibacter sp.]|nr:anion permease [Dethiosulfatibacter sp.]